jgi:hypothetical protein
MARWTLNALSLEGAKITMRKVTTPWASVTLPIYAQKAVVQGSNRNPQQVSLNITLTGNNRYAMETTIRAELENARTLLIASTSNDRLYEDKTWCWFVPQNFAVEDSSSNILKCRLSGAIDERTIHSGNFTTDWVSAGLTTVTGSPYGKYCLQSPINSTVVYTPKTALDLSMFNALNFWLKSAKTSFFFSTINLTAYSGSAYCGWQLDIPQANVWTYFPCSLAQPDFTSGEFNISAITSLQFNFTPTYPSDYIYCSWIMVD